MLMPEEGLFYFAVPVMSQDKQSSLLGYLVTILETERLEAIIASTNDERISDNDEFYLMDREGQVLISQIRQNQGRVSEDAGSKFLRFLHDQPSATGAERSRGGSSGRRIWASSWPGTSSPDSDRWRGLRGWFYNRPIRPLC